MPLAKKCDICGSFYEHYEMDVRDCKNINGIGLLNIDKKMIYGVKEVLDCCPSCMKSIKQHIEMLKGNAEEV